MKQQHKTYWEENAKEINDKRKEKIQCECGQILSKWNISKHNKTKKHLESLNNINNNGSILIEHQEPTESTSSTI